MNFVEDVFANAARGSFGNPFRQYASQRIADGHANVPRHRVIRRTLKRRVRRRIELR